MRDRKFRYEQARRESVKYIHSKKGLKTQKGGRGQRSSGSSRHKCNTCSGMGWSGWAGRGCLELEHLVTGRYTAQTVGGNQSFSDRNSSLLSSTQKAEVSVESGKSPFQPGCQATGFCPDLEAFASSNTWLGLLKHNFNSRIPL